MQIISRLRKVNPTFLLVGFFAIVAGFLLFRIDYFPFLVFDEKYYVKSAQEIFAGKEDSNFQHPIFAKWLISLPMYFIPQASPWSWRLMPFLFGFVSLIVFYLFCRKVGLSRTHSVITTVMLLGSGGWYVISRMGMLEIFMNCFVLVSAYFLYLYLYKNDFKSRFNGYLHHHYFWLSAFFLGCAIASKWVGFFPFLFLTLLFFVYLQDSFLKRALYLLLYGVVAVGVYAVISLAVVRGDVNRFIKPAFNAYAFHNTEMLTENVSKSPLFKEDVVKKYHLQGGWQGFSNFLFRNIILKFEKNEDPKESGLSNNQFIPAYFMIFTLLIILSVIAVIIRGVQKIPFALPVFITCPQILFNYFYAFFLFIPWGIIDRVQYNFYYITGFPYVLLMTSFYVFKYTSKRIQILYLVCYFAISLYRLPFWMPI